MDTEQEPSPYRGEVVDDPGDGPLYVPGAQETQLSFRAIAIGCIIGALVSAMNIRFGLKTGWSIGGSLISAILAYALFSTLGKQDDERTAFTPLETNIAQTAGSAAGSMASAAGLLSAIPAMQLLGYDLGYVELTLWAASVAWLGVFYAVPLRRQMVLVEKLRFPTGTATASTIVAMFSSGADALRKARWLLGFAVIAAAHTLLAEFVPAVAHPPLEEWFPVAALTVSAAYGFSVLVSPMMYGAGVLIGIRTASSLLFGALLAWAFLAPFVEGQGWVADPSATMSYATGARGWVLWPGVAIMVGDALTSLALSSGTIVRTFTGGAVSDDDGVPLQDPAEAIPNSWVVGGLLVATTLTVTATWMLFEIPPVLSLVAVALSSILSAIAVRSTGETDINPTGGMGKVTQLVFGGLAPGSIQTNLMSAAISSAGASQAADMMQDLKTGYLLGASPRKQIVAQLAGVTVGIFTCVPIYVAFSNNYEIGGEEYPAPAAFAWKAMAELLTQGLDALPEHALAAVLGGLAFGVAMPVLKKFTESSYVPSGLAVGVAFIVPAYYSVAMFVGAVAYQIWRRVDGDSAEALAFSVASGLIAGEGLMGVLIIVGTEVLNQLGMLGG